MVVTGTAAIVIMIVGVTMWIVDTTTKARRIQKQRAQNRAVRAREGLKVVEKRGDDSSDSPPSLPYGM